MQPGAETGSTLEPVRGRRRGKVGQLESRRQAEAGLLRDGGMTATQVCRYVQELRQEVEQDVALRIYKQASSPASDESSEHSTMVSSA